MSEEPKCPVDPKAREVWLAKSGKKVEEVKREHVECPVNRGWKLSKLLWAEENVVSNKSSKVCPVTTTTNEPESIECSSDEIDQSVITPVNAVAGSELLSVERVISSIPRTTSEGNWVYPSEKQFYNAMLRKKWEPEESDMKTVVPLHNMVNEIAWKYILNWEEGRGGEECGGIKLTSFKGDANKITPRAAINHYLFGKDLPFDRHDWKVNRCGVEIEYVIDFYTTKVENSNEPRFYLDVRPKLNTIAGIKLRIQKALGW
ncbi:hypothetical protein CANINC_004642 [Pichia inconspicua]|uniref:Holocytochrome c-type synthase n=1 Tax=Pichia inconspicua TaxID=52247 RepID=A0A4T0WVV5_9ASCO|nr:hypothetical protein CANINC_004642 [[Candida] inconspicua]